MNSILAILSAGIKQDKNGQWVSTDFSENDVLKSAPGGKLRVEAGAYLYKDNPIKIIAMGGVGGDKNIQGVNHPLISNILKRELEELGVKNNDIIQESKSINTYSQLQELMNIIRENNVEHVDIISSAYHLPRIKAMIENIQEFREFFNKNNLNLLSAENICIKYDEEKWQEIINNAYSSESMKKIRQHEDMGIKDLIDGKYKFK